MRTKISLLMVLTFGLLALSDVASADQVGSLNRQMWFADSNNAFDGGLVMVNSNNSSSPCDGAFTNTKCSPTTADLNVYNTLGLCDSTVSTPCIENVFARTDTSDWIRGVSSGERTPSWSLYSFPAKPEYELAAARRNNLFTFAGIKSDHGNLFEVTPILIRGIKKGVLQKPNALSMTIHAVYQDASEAAPGTYRSEAKSGGDVTKEETRCIDSAIYTDKCWKYDNNPSTNEFKVVLRLPVAPSGWLTGRLFNPDVKYEDVAGAASQPFRLTISGSPVPTPKLSKQYFYDVPAERASWEKVAKIFDLPWTLNYSAGPGLGPTNINEFTSAVKADSDLDIATGLVDKWLLNASWGGVYTGPLGSCTQKGFLGFVGSNALTYASELPVFDARVGTLNYQVASPHYMPTGKEFTGLYSMVLDQKYSRCIWKLGEGSISATVSVLSETGQAKIATSSVKMDDNFVRFQATGFTFSKPTLQVKLTQVKPVSATPSKNASAPKSSTITCIKGRTIKKVTAVNPKCPVGYTKK
ncbi:MAG: hypothetical protein EBU43_04285 [Actinobacteria bacterium]|nr:hypothetical protein [Actinomycetota bacterium]